MKYYLSNLLPRIKQFSEDLDIKDNFLDIPWVIIDAQQNQQKYIFRRNGDLIMSLNGQVTVGKWEYLSAAKSLLIDRNVDQILLNHSFIDKAVMVLRKDGTNDENLVLANELLLPDLDVMQYLKNLFYQKNRIYFCLLKNGENLEINNFYGYIDQNKVTIEGEPVPNQVLEVANSKRKIVIENSKIVRFLSKENYITDKGMIIIEHTEGGFPAKGDYVYTEDSSFAPDGKYKLGCFKFLTVREGRIVKMIRIF